MPLLKNASREKEFDVRVREKNVLRGVVSQEQIDKYLKNLPDDSTNADWVNLVELETNHSDRN